MHILAFLLGLVPFAIAIYVGALIYDLSTGDNPWFSIVWPIGLVQKLLAFVGKKVPATSATVATLSAQLQAVQNDVAAKGEANVALSATVATLQASVEALKVKAGI